MEGRPSCPDPALDFSCLLLAERDSLAQIFHAFISCQYFDAHVTDFNAFFCVRGDGALVADNLTSTVSAPILRSVEHKVAS